MSLGSGILLNQLAKNTTLANLHGINTPTMVNFKQSLQEL